MRRAAVRTREDLEVVAVRILEVEAAAAVATIDCVGLVMVGIGPVRQASIVDALEHLIELGLAYEESVMGVRDLAFGLQEVERYVIVGLDDHEGTEGRRLG